jgi:hypothetical protein
MVITKSIRPTPHGSDNLARLTNINIISAHPQVKIKHNSALEQKQYAYQHAIEFVE